MTESFTESLYDWKFKQPNPVAIMNYEAAGIPDILARTLINREISIAEYDDIKNHFKQLLENYVTKIENLEEASKLVLKKIQRENIKIYIFCDYDTDGITSASIAREIFKYIFELEGFDFSRVVIHIPERNEGYGLSLNWCEEVVRNREPNEEQFVITFDNGITKKPEVDYLLANGVEVLITDHHEPEDGFTPTCLVLDPKNNENKIGEELCGAEIAFILLYNVFMKLEPEDEEEFKNKIDMCIGLAAIGTIGDMMQMTEFNLSLVNAGLTYLNKGLYKPIVAIQDCFGMIEITSKDIGFNLAAAVNACGQMNDAKRAYDLLISYDKPIEEIREKAEDIYKIYTKNRDVTKKMKLFMQREIETGIFDDTNICIYPIKDIPYGIAGKLAQYVTSVTNKPAAILIDEGKEELRGSGRAGDFGIDLLGILKPFVRQNKLKYANGHKAACGVCFYRENLEEVTEEISNHIDDLIKQNKITLPEKKILNIDKVISISDINKKVYNEVNLMPYSMNFNSPNLMLEGEILKVSASKNNPNNVCYTVMDKDNKTLSIWAWNILPKLYDPNIHKTIQIVGNLNRNFMRPNTFTLDVIDLRFKEENDERIN